MIVLHINRTRFLKLLFYNRFSDISSAWLLDLPTSPPRKQYYWVTSSVLSKVLCHSRRADRVSPNTLRGSLNPPGGQARVIRDPHTPYDTLWGPCLFISRSYPARSPARPPGLASAGQGTGEEGSSACYRRRKIGDGDKTGANALSFGGKGSVVINRGVFFFFFRLCVPWGLNWLPL